MEVAGLRHHELIVVHPGARDRRERRREASRVVRENVSCARLLVVDARIVGER
jgi:hypothetical protein